MVTLKNVFSKGSLVAAMLLLLIFLFFPILFGETPVNLLGLGGRNGSFNLIINILSYSIITLLITTIVSFGASDQRKRLISNLIGICVSSLSILAYILIYLTIFWRNNGL